MPARNVLGALVAVIIAHSSWAGKTRGSPRVTANTAAAPRRNAVRENRLYDRKVRRNGAVIVQAPQLN